MTERPNDAPGSRRGLVALTVAGVLWGSIGVTVRLLQDDGMSSAAVAFWRFLGASLVLALALRRRGLGALGRALRNPGRLLAVCAASVVFQLLYFFAVRDVGAGVATLVALGVGPVALAAWESAASRNAPPPRTIVALALALAGLALVTTGDLDGAVAPHPLTGIAEAVGCGLAYAASTAWTRPLLGRLTPTAITFATSVLGTAVLLPVLAVTGWHAPLSWLRLGGTLWLSVVTTAFAYWLFYSGLRTTAGSTALVVTLLEPVTAFALAAPVLGEPITGHNVVGGGLVLAAVVSLYLRPPGRLAARRRPRASPS